MTLSNKKANYADHLDRISDLPCNVIDGILKHLNIQELVCTSLLSRKWRYVWNTVPQLVFCEDFFFRFKFKDLDDPSPDINRIINEVLLQHNGPIYRFTLDIPWFSNILITAEYFNKWLLFLSRRGIKDLAIFNYGIFSNKMPSHVFSCQELTHLWFAGFNVSVPPNFCGLKSLLVLDLQRNTYEFGALETLMSGCPLLKELSIELFGDIKSICLKKAKNLIDLRLMVNQESVSGLIKSLPNIQRLTLESCCDKTLYADIISPSHLISLKYLKLHFVSLDERGELFYIVSVLKSASNLVELVIESNNISGGQEPDQLEELERDSCCFSQLQTVNIRVGTTDFKHAMSLIQLILANSSSLKTLAFKVDFGHRKLDPAVLLSISRNLLLMERASQRARVEFTH
ncbi:F-box/FBD/LRR-repeat protein [Trifolium pratense]|uniref:F-box/FBD/LRR-repeat protein n=1 Tax=Trifolium pratense TaxID=57577 RepID=A0A2K3PD99_TRIPR|nr:F-box/FBD/LRR-repeat protein [Trifolium pratense]